MGGETGRRGDVRVGGRPRVRKVKRTVCLGAEASGRLDVQALGMGRTASEVVEGLILAWCQDYELKARVAEASGPREGKPRHG